MSKQQMEDVSEDPEATAIVERIRKMSQSEIIADIFRHEKEYRGIDWLAAAAEGPDALKAARANARAQAAKLLAEAGITETDFPGLRSMNSGDADDVQIVPAWGIDEKEAQDWKKASGDELAEMVTFRLKIMQALELSSGDIIYAQVGLSIGVVAWLKRAYDAYKVARAAGLTSLSSVVQGIRAVTLNVTKAFVAAAIVAVIAEVILFLIEKNAVVYMVLVNMTDDDLTLQDLAIVNGKQIVQFVDPLADVQVNRLNKRTVIDLGDGIESNYWIGLFSGQKRNAALIGSLGAFNFQPTPTFPNSVYVGWEIPLSGVFGGPNRCLCSAQAQPSVNDFAQKTQDNGTLFSTDSSGKGTVTARMHSGSGSEGYMSVIFEAN
jgi:hypothetical protein